MDRCLIYQYIIMIFDCKGRFLRFPARAFRAHCRMRTTDIPAIASRSDPPAFAVSIAIAFTAAVKQAVCACDLSIHQIDHAFYIGGMLCGDLGFPTGDSPGFRSPHDIFCSMLSVSAKTSVFAGRKDIQKERGDRKNICNSDHKTRPSASFHTRRPAR